MATAERLTALRRVGLEQAPSNEPGGELLGALREAVNCAANHHERLAATDEQARSVFANRNNTPVGLMQVPGETDTDGLRPGW